MPITVVRKGAVDEVAARLQGRLRKAYLDAIDVLKGNVDAQALADAIAKNDFAQALSLLQVDFNFDRVLRGHGARGIASFKSAVAAAYQAGAQNAANELPSRIKLNTAFDLLNPRSIEFIQNYSFHLIQQITEESRASIRQALLRAFQEGGHPFQQARWIRDSIGLTTRQEKAVANYRRMLEGTSPHHSLTRALRDRRYDASVRAGRLDQDRIDRMVSRYRERYVQYRAQTIARTETVRAANRGQREIWKQAQEQGELDPDEYERVWIVSGDKDTCDDCDALDGETVGLDEEFPDGDPPLHPDCVVGETLVAAEGIRSVFTRWYEGDVLILRTASGKNLTCTPNHPVLTNRGWTPAYFLDVGDDVIRRLAGDRIEADKDQENVPTRIEDLVRAFRESRQFRLREVPVSAQHFHGDGRGSKVAVVYADRFLRRRIDSAPLQHLSQLDFGWRALESFALDGLRVLQLALERYASAAARGVRGVQHCAALLGAGPLPALAHGFAAASELDALFHQDAVDDGARDSVLLADRDFRHSGVIFTDHIVSRNVCSFRGHVYNLETVSGEYTADSIITHNCRCTTALQSVNKRDRKRVA